MRFPSPLRRGTLVRRYQRFLADVVVDDGSVVTAHCANSGSMLGVKEPGSEVWLSPAANPARKLRYTWEIVRAEGTLVGINTNNPNILVAEAVAAGRIAELAGYPSLRREVRYGRNSRIDLLLGGEGRADCYVEVKNVHLRRGVAADGEAPVEFPDSVTARGTKHLAELIEVVRCGGRAVMVYLVQRADAPQFRIAADIDPAYAAGLAAALAAGVEAVCYRCAVTPEAIEVTDRVPLIPPA